MPNKGVVDRHSVDNFVDDDFFRHNDRDHTLATMKILKNILKNQSHRSCYLLCNTDLVAFEHSRYTIKEFEI